MKVRGIFTVEEVGSAELHPTFQCSDVSVWRLKRIPVPHEEHGDRCRTALGREADVGNAVEEDKGVRRKKSRRTE